MFSIRFLAILFTLFFMGLTAQARDTDEAHLLLREAMMESNADYNKYKKKVNSEEFDRADDWSSRDSGSIEIGHTHSLDSDLSEFKEKTEATINERDLSSTDSIQDSEKHHD